MLLEAGVDVVGRTRFCIHPAQARAIPVVGGTKDLNAEKLRALRPDLLVLDKEENLPWMNDQAPCRTLVSHVDSITAMRALAEELARELPGHPALARIGERWRSVEDAPPGAWNWARIPTASTAWETTEGRELLYVIWKDPWMAVAGGTFIASVFEKLGAGAFFFVHAEKYPKLAAEELARAGRVVLFSSEPFPFGRFQGELRNWAPRGALVDGESFSWFGTRSLRFLERELFGAERS